MSDVVKNAKIGVSGVNNGAIVIFVQETGEYQKKDPDLNVFVPSGVLFSRYNDRFNKHYGGGAT